MSLTDDILMHYGMPRRSGRYPWGSGDNPYQHSGDFLSRVEELKKSNFTFTDKDGKTYTGEVAIAKSMGLSTTQFRTQMSLAKDERRSADVATAKRWESNGVYHFRCSDTPQDDTWDCWCNYDRNNNQIDHFYTPIYFGSLVSGKLRSISGAANSVNTTAANEIAYAKANGNDWYTEVLADRLLLQDLLVMMARSTECQTAFGYGQCNSSNSNAIAPGTMNTKGMFWGSNDQTSGVKVFGMENVWGNLWRRTAGWINANGTQKVKLTRGTHDGSTATDYNTDGNGYKTIANATPAGSSGGYISSMKTEAFGRLPVTASGSSSTYEADGMWYNNSQVNYACVGGSWNGDLMVGPFSATLTHAASYSSSYIGAALSCKPLAAA